MRGISEANQSLVQRRTPTTGCTDQAQPMVQADAFHVFGMPMSCSERHFFAFTEFCCFYQRDSAVPSLDLDGDHKGTPRQSQAQ